MFELMKKIIDIRINHLVVGRHLLKVNFWVLSANWFTSWMNALISF